MAVKNTDYDTKQKMTEFAERFNAALDEYTMVRDGHKETVPPKFRGRAKWVAIRFGLSSTGARKWLEALAMPDQARWAEIALSLGVRMEWLFFGLGPMRGESDLAPTSVPNYATGGDLLGIILDAIQDVAPELPRQTRLNIASAIFTRLQKP